MDRWQLVRRLLKGVVRRRKTLAVATFVGAVLLLGPVAFYTSKEPPRFRTTAVILMESRPDKVPIFQEFTPFRPLPVQLAILRSRSLAETVLENLPKSALNDLLERSYQVDYLSLFQTAYQRIRGIEPHVESPMRRALAELQQARMRFDFKTDGIVEITAEASKPQVAVDIVNTYIEVLLARTRSFNVDDARTSREFLERQLADVKRSLTTSEDALRNFNAGHGGVKVPERSKTTVEQLSSTETALAEMETSRKMMQTRLQALREKAENQRRQPPAAARTTTATAPQPASPDIQRLRGQLTQLETTLLELRSKFTDEHPRVLLVKDRIGEVRRQLGDAVKESTGPVQASPAIPPVERVNFGEQVIALETALHSLTAQEDALRKQAETLRQSLTGLSRSEHEYTRLTRDVESSRHLHALLSDKLTGARMREQGEMKVVKVIDPPGLPQTTSSDKRLLFLGFAFVAALAIGSVVPVGVEWIHRAVETEDDVESLGLPVLAVLPRLRKRPPRFLSTAETHRLKQVDESFMFSEALRNLRVTIQLTHRSGAPRSVLVASGFSGEGKSTLVVSLGMAFGEAGYRVVLADTDFQRPTLSRVLKLAPSAPGISDALEAEGTIGGALVPAGDRVWVAPRGRSFQPLARGMLATSRLKTVVDEMTEHADIVICDSSPILLIPDNLFLASNVEGVILVARAGTTRCRDLARTKALLEAAGARLLGVVINEMPAASLRRHYTNYYQTYVKQAVPARPV